ncbi:MAG: hypothetical protein WDM78_12455 [Puia sp.]
MNRKKERELHVLTWLTDKDLTPVSEIQAKLEMTGDEGFQIENTLNDLVKEGYLEQKSQEAAGEAPEGPSWELTETGRLYLNDLSQEKYEEKNKIPVYIWAVIIVVAILTFMKLFPRMFH